MFNRSVSDKLRVTSSPSPKATTNKYLDTKASAPKTLFTSRTQFVEDGVVIVDDSKQSNSDRSVEITKHELLFTNESGNSKRNRLFDSISIMSPRASHIDRAKQLRLTIPCVEEGGKSNIRRPSSASRSGSPQREVKKESTNADDCCVATCSKRKAITFSAHDDFPTSSVCKSVDGQNAMVGKSEEDFHDVGSLQGKKADIIEDKAKTAHLLPHVHKSETLTVIIPKRKVATRKPDTVTQSKELMSNNNVDVITPKSHSNNAEVEKNTANMRESARECNTVPTGLMVPKDDLQPISDDDSDDKSELSRVSDMLILTSVGSRGTIVSYSSRNSLFSNHYPCQRLIIHGQRFFSTEQYYVWTKAKFCKDFHAANVVFNSEDSKQIAEIGNHLDKLENIDVNRWMTYSWKVRMKAAMAKYKQNRRLRYQLFRTIGSVLVEANKYDTYWACGLSIGDPNLADMSKWRGYNVMGEVLMQIRDVLQFNAEYANEVDEAKKHLFTI